MLTTTKYNLEQRKLFMLAPVPVLLCLLLVFHGLGGGKGGTTPSTAVAQGVNKTLPSAKPDSSIKAPDKMQIYAQAAADSAKFREQQKQDPNIAGSPIQVDSLIENLRPRVPVMPPVIDQRRRAADATADRVMKRVEQLKLQLAKPVQQPSTGPIPEREPAIAQLRTMPAALETNPVAARDPEMERIDAMLDKLIRIQHPDMIVSDTTTKSPAGKTFVLERPTAAAATDNLSQASVAAGEEPIGFIEIGEEDKPDTVQHSRDQALAATVDGDQTVTSGSVLSLQLSNAAVVNGLAIPAGQQLYGEVSVANQRLMIHISSLRIGDQVLPVSLLVYDLDGLAGIRVPGAITREVSKESASEAVSGLGLASMDPSLTGQAANAGLQLAKSLTSRKIRLVRVQLPAGYQVLLVNTKTK